MADYALSNAVEHVAAAIQSVAQGGADGPAGIEAVTLAIAGSPRDGASLCQSLDGISDAINRLAAAVEAIAER
jgi:hypothetical protein